MARPNLFLVGAAKSGTTSLANYLDQHPKVHVSQPKEPNFYALPEGQPLACKGPADSDSLVNILLAHSVTARSAYETLFAGAEAASYRVDASVRYLYHSDSPQRIFEAAPDAHIVALLRDPIQRLHSHYHMNVKFGVEPESFERALALEDERVAQGWGWDWHYVRVGRYAEQLQRYYDRFPADRIHVIMYSEFSQDLSRVLETLYHQLGLESQVKVDSQQRSNVGQTPKYRWLRKLLWEDNLFKTVAKRMVPQSARTTLSEWIERKNRVAIPPVPAHVEARLRGEFQDDKEQLEALLGRGVPW